MFFSQFSIFLLALLTGLEGGGGQLEKDDVTRLHAPIGIWWQLSS